MAKCPKCNKNLPILKVMSLTKPSNGIECSNCGIYLNANKAFLTRVGGIGGGIASIMGINLFSGIKEGNPDWWIDLIIIISFFIGLLLYNDQYITFKTGVKPKIKKKQKKEVKPYKKPKTRNEELKNIHYKSSNSDLMEIISSKNIWTEETKIAAKELLEERNNSI